MTLHTESEEPSRPTPLKDRDDPNAAKLKTDKAEPRRTNDRMETELPK